MSIDFDAVNARRREREQWENKKGFLWRVPLLSLALTGIGSPVIAGVVFAVVYVFGDLEFGKILLRHVLAWSAAVVFGLPALSAAVVALIPNRRF